MSGWFFFQAEDGIRDLVRSRGLGDVYKRQALQLHDLPGSGSDLVGAGAAPVAGVHRGELLGRRPGVAGVEVDPEHLTCLHPVSYTHLTLPTSDLV